MANYSALDRHILSFKGSPFVAVQRDVKFVVGGECVNQLSYFLTYNGQIKEILFNLNDLTLDVENLKEKLVKGKVSARNFEISLITTGDSTAFIDYEFQILCQFKIQDGVLEVAGESIESQTAEFQLNLRAFRCDDSLRVSN